MIKGLYGRSFLREQELDWTGSHGVIRPVVEEKEFIIMSVFAKAVIVSGVLGACFAYTPNASALGLLTTFATNAAGNCQPALPTYDGLIRKRPLAVINEGTSSAFITCAFTSELAGLGISTFGTRVTNTSAVPQTVNCTAVTGREGSASYFVKSLTLAPGAAGQITYDYLLDNTLILFNQRISLSCNIPPGVGLNDNSATSVLSLL